MNKAEQSAWLAQQVEAKVKEGYTIPTYAMDAATRDRLKRELRPHGREFDHEDPEDSQWDFYLQDVEAGTYAPPAPRIVVSPPPALSVTEAVSQNSASGNGLWKARRH